MNNEAPTPSAIPNKDKQGKSLYACNHCNEKFARQDGLDRHEFTHTGIKKFSCTEHLCRRQYTNRSHLNRHIRTVHRKTELKPEKLKCRQDTCLRMFSNKSSMMKHFKNIHLGLIQFKCHHCNESFCRKNQLKAHMFQHTNQLPYLCEICGKGFLTQRPFRHHRALHHSYKCNVCKEDFDKWSALQVHRRNVHSTTYECKICKKILKNRTILKSHMLMHPADSENRLVFQCPIDQCSKFYFQKSNLQVHIRRKHTPFKPLEFECQYCGQKISSKQKIIAHFKKYLIDEKMKCTMKPKSNTVKVRNQRTSTSIKKLSSAAKLTGLRTSNEIEKLICNGEGNKVTVVFLQSDDLDTNESENAAICLIK